MDVEPTGSGKGQAFLISSGTDAVKTIGAFVIGWEKERRHE